MLKIEEKILESIEKIIRKLDLREANAKEQQEALEKLFIKIKEVK